MAAAASTWIAVGAADPGRAVHASSDYSRRGDFGAYGVSVPVDLAGEGLVGESLAGGDEPLPLTMLIAGWLRAEATKTEATKTEATKKEESQAISVIPLVVDPGASPAECAERGRELAGLLASTSEPVGVLVVADGATALTPSAPGGGQRESAVALQQVIDAALADADLDALAALDPDASAADGVGGRAAWQVLAAACTSTSTDVPLSVRSDVLYSDAPFGVGYTVAVWTPLAASGATP